MADKFFGSLFDAPTSDVSLPQDVSLPEVKAARPEIKPEIKDAPKASGRAGNLMPPEDMRPIFEASAKEFNVPVNVLMAIAHQESNYVPSRVGKIPTKYGRAKGIMQYLDSTAAGLGINPFDPAQAIPAAAKQLSERLRKGYSMEDAVKEHFAGPDRRQWGEKTAAYGREVMEKVGKIGELIDGGSSGVGNADLQKRLDAEEPGRYRVMSEDQAMSMFSPNTMSREAYEGTFLKLNPNASQAAIDNAMGDYDKARAAKVESATSRVQNRFDTMQSPEAMFDQRLNRRLQGPANGIVPQLPGKEAPEKLGYDPDAANRESKYSAVSSYIGKSLKSGMYDLLGAGAKILDEINPWTLSPSDAAVLFKDDPEKLKKFQDESSAMILSRFARSMTKNADESMSELSDRAKRDYGSLKYMTTDQEKAAYRSPTKVIGDAVRSLPSTAAMAVSVYLTKGAAARAEQSAMAAGMSQEAAKHAAVMAGAKAMATAGAVSEGAVGYAQQANQSAYDASKILLSELSKSPKFQRLIAEGFTPEAARAKIIADTGEEAGQIAGIVDAAVNKVGGEFLGKIITEGGSLIPRIMKGAANESATEFVQSAGEKAGENIAIKDNINPNQSISKDVGESAVAGGFVGGLMGGVASGVAGSSRTNTTANEATATPAAPATTVVAVPAEKSTAAGPLTRAIENAADQHANSDVPPRVTVVAPEGTITGFAQDFQEDDHGGFMARVLGDDGQVYQFTDNGGVQITVEQKTQAGPLTSAVEKAAEEHAQQKQAAPETKPEIPALENQQVADVSLTNEGETKAAEQPAAAAPGSDAGNGFKQGPQAGERYRVGVVDAAGGAVAMEKRLPAGTAATFYVGIDGNLIDGDYVDLSRQESRSRLWVPSDAKQASQATQLLDEIGKLSLSDPRRAEAKRQLKSLVTGNRQNAAPVTQQPADVPSAQTVTAPPQGEASQQTEKIDMSGRTDQQLATIAESGKTPEKRAAAAAEIERRKQAAPELRLEDMDEPQLRARMKYITGQAKANGGWNKLLTTARKEVEREINRRKEATSDQGTDTAAVRVRDERAQGAEVPAQAQGDQQGAGAASPATGGEQRAVSGKPESGDGTAVSGAGTAADTKPALKVGETAHFVAGPYAGTQGEIVEVKPSGAIVLKANNEIGSRLMGQPAELSAGPALAAEEPKKAKAKQPNGSDSKKAEALFEAPQRDEYAGKWFGSKEKAEAFIAKKKAGATHEVVQTGKVRFEVKPKETVKESLTVQAADQVPGDTKMIEAEAAVNFSGNENYSASNEGSSVDGKWVIGIRPFMGGKYTVYQLRKINGSVRSVYVQDSRTGDDALFDTEEDAVAVQKMMQGQGVENVPEFKRLPSKQAEAAPAVAVETPVVERDEPKAETTTEPTGNQAGSKTPVKTGYALADYWANSASASIENDVKAGRSKVVDLTGEKPTDPTPPKGGKPAVSENKVFTEDAAAKARALLKSRLSGTQLNSGIDPEIMQAGITLAGYHIEKGARTFAAYAKAMIDDMGDAIRPYLKSWYLGVRFDPRAAGFDGMSTAAEVEGADTDAMLENPAASPTMEVKEPKQNDTEPTQADAGTGAEGQAAGPVRADEGGRDAGGNAEPAGGERGAGARGDARGAGERPAVPGDQRPAAEGTGSQQPAESGRGSGDEPSDRGNRKPRSSVTNYRIQPGELKREGSWRATSERNVQIVELVKQIESEGRQPNADERALMAKFTGWGASEIANGIFPDQYGRYKNADWQSLGQRLKAALTDDEYSQAKRTTQYAHYTSEGIIRGIWGAFQRLGFAGGSFVEPGMGIGHFNGLMPDGIAANSTYTGIEYDTLTGMIAKALYPASNVIVGDYTRTNLPKDFFDAAVGNPPFSQTQVLNDPEYKNRRPMLHDYFFMKTIDRVKPGGLLVFVTSKGTMDKTSDKSRKYLGERANLLGAIRLPQTAFKENAGTEVVTDVIFLQKRGDGIEDNGVAWMNTKEVQTPQGPTAINEYFADHPEMVLGTHALAGSMYRANEYTVLPMEGDIEAHFAEAVRKLPENVTKPSRGSAAERAVVQDRDFNPKHKKEGGLYLSDEGKLMQVESGTGVELEYRSGADGKRIALTPKQKKWLKGYVGVRDALKQAQFDQLNDGPWEKSLKALNKAYDAFVKENGPILDYTVIERTNEDGAVTETKRLKNAPLFQTDVEGALVYALETIKEDGAIEKGAALRERVLERHRDPEIKTTQDAMFVSLNRLGSLNLDDVAALAGTDRETIVRDLGTAIYEAPGKGWQLADEYLSGNVVRKLKEAQAAAEINPAYKRNVEALLAVQPRPLGPTEITVRLGANWVPASDVAAFASDVLGDRMDITYSPVVGRWSVDQKSRSVSEWAFDKMSAGEILESMLNSRQIKVTFRDSEGKTHVDVEATEKANDIAAKMRERFRTWIWADTKRADRLVKFYNENFNNIAPRSFDGSHLTLPGVSARFKLYPHQKRAVWRIIQQGDVYLAHAVGAGKTMEMIAAGMEERRLGLVNKPMYVVPNHMLAQFSREFLELYPAANIMVADENNFHNHNRKRFVAQAALNNPDAIIITHSAFGRIAMSDEFSAKFIQDQIDAWKEALDDVDKSDRITVKQIERRIEQLERRLEGKQGKDKKDQVLTFEELGVDKLYVDEFHEFRKLDFATNQGSVKGIDPNGSQRALDLQMKTEYLRGKKPGRALVAASGTPVTNTMGELFTAQRFFQPDQLREDGLDTFDAWSAQYGDIVTGFEQNAAGGYEMVSRFAKFQNVPELMRRVRSFMDILTSSNLGELVKRPDVIGGGREVVVTPVPDGYKEYQQELQGRIQRIRNRKGPPKKGEDIILNVIADGRFSAIDMRFVDPTLPSDPNSKLNLWIDDIIAAYKETADYEFANKVTGKPDPIKGASIIGFSDIGLGEASAANRGFDMRAWIEKRLADAGIPKEHVAFMRDHKQSQKKERLFADMREGKRRILIGGKEMETGTNVQKRLTHLFHLDAPWFPASVEQREGRIVRQGNQNKKVKINAYATKGSYDSTMWGMNARKARFIEQAMNGDDTVRSLEDVSEASAFEMAAALASGDERYLKLAGLKTEVERLERLRHAHYQDQNSLRRDKHWSEEIITRNEAKAKELKEAIAKRIPIRAGEFSGKVGKATFDSREEFSQAIFKAFKKLADDNHVGDKAIAEIGGFDVVFYGAEMKGSGEYVAGLHVSIPGDPDSLVEYPVDPDFAVSGIATRAANQVNGMDRDLATAENRITDAKRKIEQINARLGATFPEEAILLEKVAELSALEEELSAESEAANADAAAATVEAEEGPKFSVAAGATEAGFDVDRAWRDLIGRNKFADFDEQAEFIATRNDDAEIGSGAMATPRDFTLSRQEGKQWVSLSVRETTLDSGETAFSSSLEVGDDGFKKGTGIATRMYLAALRVTQNRGIGWVSEGVRSDDSIAIYARLKKAGVPFKRDDASSADYINAEDLAKIDLQDVADRIAAAPRYSVGSDGNSVAEFGPVHTEYKDDPNGAIKRLMTDKTGEAIIDHPQLGEISLIYGDEMTGLRHIAERRGAEFMQRLPDLLKNGVLFSKTNQKGRVFIGNDRDEAVVRLDWNQQAKAWLLSAYEKYPDLNKAGEVQQSRRSQTVEQRTDKPMTKADLQKSITSGVIGSVVARMIDAGVIQLHDTARTLPKEVGKNVRGIQAVTMPDSTIHMVANTLTRENARGVLLHEMFHRGGEKLIGSTEWSSLMGRLGSLYRQSEQSTGRAREFFDQARARVAAAKKQGAVPVRMEVEEFAAYTIEEYERAPESLPAAIRKWVEDLIGMVKAWMLKAYGKQIGQVTPAQLAAFAKLAVMDVAIARRGEMFGPIGELFSVDGSSSSVPLGKPSVLESRTDSGSRYAKLLSDLFVSESFRLKGLGGLNIPSQRVVLDGVLRFGKDSKVIGSIVQLIPVDVMDVLSRKNVSAESLFRNKSVLKNLLSSDSNGSVSSAVYVADALATAIAGVTAKGVLPGPLVSAIDKELGSAERAGILNGSHGEIKVVGNNGIVNKTAETGNSGDFDPTNPDIRYSVAPEQDQVTDDQLKNLTPDEQGLLRRVQSALQDNMNRLKEVQDRIKKLTGLKELGSFDYYRAEANRPGRIAARLEDGKNQFFEPLIKELAEAKKTPEQLEELLHAMHAKERNERIAKINDDMPDGGSGMMTADAEKILDKYRDDKALHDIADKARSIAKETLALKHAYGLIDDETLKALNESYEFYVPLKGEGEFGPKIKRAMGHESRDERILDNIARDYNQAIVVGEKNLARQSLLKMVLKFNDDALWTARVPPKGRYIAGRTFYIMQGGKKVAAFDSLAQATAYVEGAKGLAEIVDAGGEKVAEYTKPLQDNEVMVYVNGQPVRIQIKDAKLATQLRPLDQARMNPILEAMRGLNQYLAKIYTGYNPAFMLRNMVRDSITGTINILGREGAKTAAQAWKNYPKAISAIGQWATTKQTPNTETGKYLNQYRMYGGKVGASWMSDLEQQGKTLQRMYEDAYGASGYLADGKKGKAALVAGRKIIGGMAHAVEIGNQATENALRLALFIALREQGVSAPKAAQAAKTVTVDFDRKGTATPALGAIYLFINPAIQGTANAMNTLINGEHKAEAWTALAALAALGMYAAFSGMDDDKDRWLGQSWDSRTKNFILNVGGHEVRVPISYEFAPYYAFGIGIGEALRGEKPMRSAHNIVSSFIDAYFPLPNAYNPDSDNKLMDAAMSAVPTAVKPAVEIGANRNTFGSQIVPESEFTKDNPDTTKMYRATKGSVYDAAAQVIAAPAVMAGISGQYENDLTKVSPETVKYLWRTYTGGLGQFITDTIGAGWMAATDPEAVTSSDVPFVKDFYKANDVKPIRSRYYNLAREARAAAAEFKQAEKVGDDKSINKILADDEKMNLISVSRSLTKLSREISELRDIETEINADKSLSVSEKRKRLKENEAQQEELYRAGISMFRKAGS